MRTISNLWLNCQWVCSWHVSYCVLNDVDIPLCRGLLDVKIDPHQLNCVEFVWDPRPQVETKVAIKVHCISTEFTAKKHGGEKGVPFRIQVETYAHGTSANDDVSFLLHCASCQVKVFKVCWSFTNAVILSYFTITSYTEFSAWTADRLAFWCLKCLIYLLSRQLESDTGTIFVCIPLPVES